MSETIKKVALSRQAWEARTSRVNHALKCSPEIMELNDSPCPYCGKMPNISAFLPHAGSTRAKITGGCCSQMREEVRRIADEIIKSP